MRTFRLQPWERWNSGLLALKGLYSLAWAQSRSDASPGFRLGLCGALALVLLLVACGGDGLDAPASREGLEAIPHPELSAAEPAVVRQLDGLRDTLQARLDDPETSRRDLADAFRQLGERYHAYDLVGAAAPCYRNALHLVPGDRRVHHLLGVLARLEGDHSVAHGQLELALAASEGADPTHAVATQLHLAFLELAMDQPAEANARALELITGGLESAAAHVVQGQAAMALEDPQGAVEAFERALELQPTAGRVHYLAAQAYRKLGDLDAARGHLEQQNPAEVGFADPTVASLYTDLAGSAAIMQRAAGAKAAGFLEASVESYRRAVANAPESPEARRDLGALLAQTGQLDQAIDQYREALRLEPDKALNAFSLALVLEAQGLDDEALGHFRTAVDREPDYREFRLVLAERLATAGALEEAHGHFDRLLDRDPSDFSSRLQRAKVRAELGDPAGALDDARSVVEGDAPANLRARAFHVQADLAARQGDRASARALLDRALALDPELPEAHFSLGTLAGMDGDFESALRSFARVTAATPERAAAWLGEATALALLGREAEAAQRLEAGLGALPGQGSLAFTLARLRLSANDPAVRDGARALELAQGLFQAQATPEHAEILAQALAATGQRTEAVALYRQLLEQLPPGADPSFGQRWRAEITRLENLR